MSLWHPASWVAHVARIAPAGLIRKTGLDEIAVWALAGGIALLTPLILRRRPWGRTLRSGLATVSAGMFLSLGLLAALRFELYRRLTREDHLVEWLTAMVLLTAAIVMLAAAVRQARSGRASPMTVFLAAGLLWAAARELEWGQAFLGAKTWYSRNLFRWNAYVEPAYFDRFREELNLSLTGQTMYRCHLIASAIFLLAAAGTLVYVLRHRGTFVRQLRQLAALAGAAAARLVGPDSRRHRRLRRLPRLAHLRYFLLGTTVYIVSQVFGRLFAWVLKSDSLDSWRRAHDVGHRVLDEPFELWGALIFLAAAVALWATHDRRPGRQVRLSPYRKSS